jgi:transcriptional regulator with XRE-family HTH domain
LIHETQSFGTRLRAERERRGISLDVIAERTKIQKAFLESLERGDFSRWPAGEVFRRSYLRDYATAIGLSPESVVCEFSRLALDEPASTPEVAPLSMTFDRAPNWRDRLQSRSARAALLDISCVVAVGVLTVLSTGVSVWTSIGMWAFVYYPSAALWGRSVGTWLTDPRRRLPLPLQVVPAPSKVMEVDQPVSLYAGESAVHTAVGRLEAVVDPLLLTRSERASSPHAPHASAAH